MAAGHALAGISEGARNAGCDAFVTKPCLPEDLVKEIRIGVPAVVEGVDAQDDVEKIEVSAIAAAAVELPAAGVVEVDDAKIAEDERSLVGLRRSNGPNCCPSGSTSR